MEHKNIIISDVLVHYIATNKEAAGKPALLFLHGWRSSAEAWKEVAQVLVQYGYQVFLLDLPGFGKSEPFKKAAGVSDYVKLVDEFVTKMRLENVALVGHSFGGRIGIKLSALHPHWLSKLVLIDSGGVKDNSSLLRLKKLIARMVSPFFKLPLLRNVRYKIYQFIGAEDYMATPELRQTFVNVINEDLVPDMKDVRVPALIVWGGSDVVTPLWNGHLMHKSISSSILEILGGGHYVFLDQPGRFLSLLLKFVAK
jgi:pimeloyl-ACP methyl ester carboxylesterase